MIELTNQIRLTGAVCGGVPYPPAAPVTYEPHLQASARAHSADMAARGYYSHNSPEGSTPSDRTLHAGYSGPVVGENIAAGQVSPEDVVHAWLLSPGHCANMLDPHYSDLGVGFTFDPTSERHTYWVQNFGSLTDSVGGEVWPGIFFASVPPSRTTVDLPLRYDVGVQGAAEFALSIVEGPTGMSANDNLKRVEWLPTGFDLWIHMVTLRVDEPDGSSDTQTFALSVESTPELVDPALVAPPLKTSGLTSFVDQVSFLYSGSETIQRGLAAGKIRAKTVSVIRGTVIDRSSARLGGVRVSVLGDSAFGETYSRADGAFDLAVNGGKRLTLVYEKAGYISAQRQLRVPWRAYVNAPDVALVPHDSVATTVNALLGQVQVAEGSITFDERGERQATLVFKPSTTMQLELSDGSLVPQTSLSVRATELTVGLNGRKAMPAELPTSSAYTYAVELTADEALAVNAASVKFDPPFATYIQNFLQIPVGSSVPVGVYDRQLGAWRPEPNGLVVRILDTTLGLASIDTTGDSVAESDEALALLGIDHDERSVLAARFGVGTELWRVSLSHFSTNDFNYGSTCLSADNCPESNAGDPQAQHCSDCQENADGSIIECQNQAVRELVPLVGTPFGLAYSSMRTPGRSAAKSVEVPLTGASIPSGLVRVRSALTVAGNTLPTRVFDALPNLDTTFTWTGTDAYGRIPLGSQSGSVFVEYEYSGAYAGVPRFAATGVSTGPLGPSEFTLTRARSWDVTVGTWDARSARLGGWTLTGHHFYDPVGGYLYYGDGTQRQAQATMLKDTIRTVAGPDALDPVDIVVDSQGRLIILNARSQVFRIEEFGARTVLAGTGVPGFSGDGGPAVAAQISASAIAIDDLGNLFIADDGNYRIRQVDKFGKIDTIVGTGEVGFDFPISQAPITKLQKLQDLAVGPDRSLYFVEQVVPFDFPQGRVRRVWPDGPAGTYLTVEAITGPPRSIPPIDGNPSRLEPFVGLPTGLAVDDSGNVYFPISGRPPDRGRIYRIEAATGRIYRIAGDYADLAEGAPAISARLTNPGGLMVSRTGELIFTELGRTFSTEPIPVGPRVRKIDTLGRVQTIAGSSEYGFGGDGGRPRSALFQRPWGLALDGDGAIYVSDFEAHRVRKITTGAPEAGAAFEVPSEDGSAQYVFDLDGRHLETKDTRTGRTLLSFEYDSADRLTRAVDLDGQVTTIERDLSGNPTAIVGPYGARTNLQLNPHGWVERVTNPAGESFRIEYHDAGGLISKFHDPKDNPPSMYVFDEGGRLSQVQDRTGATTTYARVRTPEGYKVKKETQLGRATMTSVTVGGTVDEGQVRSDPSGLESSFERRPDGTQVSVSPDGTRTETKLAPDPRFGLSAPFAERTQVTLPSGLTSVVTATKSAVLGNEAHPFKLTSETSRVTTNGRTFTSTYDAVFKKTTTQSPLGRVSETFYNDAGRISESRVPGILPVSYTYDSLGRVETVSQGTRATRYSYDAEGRLRTV
ncbi:MAG: hypothetical protein HY791_16500, partial [Deltaproteobacteria bacterium]|nr:hypothetical protein [Deltaproteobacteria bacterium]